MFLFANHLYGLLVVSGAAVLVGVQISCGKALIEDSGGDSSVETGDTTITDTSPVDDGLCKLVPDIAESSTQPQLSVEELFSSAIPGGLVDYSAFTPQDGDGAALHQFNGTFELQTESSAQSELLSITYWVPDEMGTPRLPDMEFGFTQCGNTLIPRQRGRVSTEDPNWDLFVSPGTVWSNSNDISPEGEPLSRASFPFAMAFKVENCLQNGVMTFLFNDSEISNVRYQVSSETCPFLKFNLFGQSEVVYDPTPVERSDEIREVWLAEEESKLPITSFSELLTGNPELSESSFNLGLTMGALTTRGLVMDGTIYLDECRTRSGSYPFCESVLLPAYSITKTLHLGVGLAAMALTSTRDPYGVLLSELLPEAIAGAAGDWSQVTIEHTLDMSTGHYQVLGQGDDAMTDFYTDFSIESRLESAFAFPYKEPPGQRTVYLTPNSQLAAAAMDQLFIGGEIGESDHDDSFRFLLDKIYRPIGVTLDSQTVLRTWENGGENNGTAFGGYGMALTPSNLSIIAEFMLGDGVINGERVLDADKWDDTMFRNIEDIGAPMYFYDWSYNNGMWGYPLSSFGCEGHVPVMFGVSGNTVILAPNGITYFAFNDEAEFPVYNVLSQLNAISPLCE